MNTNCREHLGLTPSSPPSTMSSSKPLNLINRRPAARLRERRFQTVGGRRVKGDCKQTGFAQYRLSYRRRHCLISLCHHEVCEFTTDNERPCSRYSPVPVRVRVCVYVCARALAWRARRPVPGNARVEKDSPSGFMMTTRNFPFSPQGQGDHQNC